MFSFSCDTSRKRYSIQGLLLGTVLFAIAILPARSLWHQVLERELNQLRERVVNRVKLLGGSVELGGDGEIISIRIPKRMLDEDAMLLRSISGDLLNLKIEGTIDANDDTQFISARLNSLECSVRCDSPPSLPSFPNLHHLRIHLESEDCSDEAIRDCVLKLRRSIPKTLRSLELTGFDDIAFEALGTDLSLDYLSVAGEGFTGRGFSSWTETSHLKHVYLSGELANLELQGFPPSPKLRMLSISSPSVTEIRLDWLVKTPKIESLYLSGCVISGEVLSKLRPLRRLSLLELEHAKFDIESLTGLNALDRKVSLHWSNCEVTGASVVSDTLFTRVSALDAWVNEKETDLIMRHISRFVVLESLVLKGPSLSDEQLRTAQFPPKLRFCSVSAPISALEIKSKEYSAIVFPQLMRLKYPEFSRLKR
jgi:hypothetical protein